VANYLNNREIFYTIYDTKILGKVILYGNSKHLKGLEFYKEGFIQKRWIKNDKIFKKVVDELDLYFKGSLKEFKTPVKPEGTDFQKRVYKELLKIPYGTTVSYKELAKRVGSPKAFRAVGNANGKNPIAIIIPCHRVISSDGSIGGYSGGLDKKRKLLKLEGVQDV